jgi:hypothetical protein
MFIEDSLTLALRLTGVTGQRRLTQDEILGWIRAALQAAQSWGFWGLYFYPRAAPWAGFLRPFRPPH